MMVGWLIERAQQPERLPATPSVRLPHTHGYGCTCARSYEWYTYEYINSGRVRAKNAIMFRRAVTSDTYALCCGGGPRRTAEGHTLVSLGRFVAFLAREAAVRLGACSDAGGDSEGARVESEAASDGAWQPRSQR